MLRMFFMSNFENPFKDFVFSLPEDKLDLLIECINNRKDYDLYGVTNLEDAAIKYGRKPMCPKCSCENYIENGHTPAYHKRLNVRIVDVLIHYYRIPFSIQVRYLFIRY